VEHLNSKGIKVPVTSGKRSMAENAQEMASIFLDNRKMFPVGRTKAWRLIAADSAIRSDTEEPDSSDSLS
jgi:hypothetical protein